jgi:hypothetical protein
MSAIKKKFSPMPNLILKAKIENLSLPRCFFKTALNCQTHQEGRIFSFHNIDSFVLKSFGLNFSILLLLFCYILIFYIIYFDIRICLCKLISSNMYNLKNKVLLMQNYVVKAKEINH